jgi:hypothetical protein
MWYGSAASVPAGWALCNGGSGTPNLQDRFVVAAGSGYGPGATGGESTTYLQVGHLPPHSHGIPDLSHSHTGGTDGRCASNSGGGGCGQMGYGNDYQCCGVQFGIYTNATTWTSGMPTSTYNAGSGWGIENRPLFYALCYIMKI